MWFKNLTGFTEESPTLVRKNISVNGETMTSSINGQQFTCGTLTTPTLSELRQQVSDLQLPSANTTVREQVANVQDLHIDTSNAGAFFQVASQFNLLEMTGPNVTPEQGVDGYERDLTQGPACAIAAGAGTIYRNYFADVDGQIGQSAERQIDCLRDIGLLLDNSGQRLWEMSNGYALASASGLAEITAKLEAAAEDEIDSLRAALRVGVQSNTEVTLSASKHTVCQVFCSATPVAYSTTSPSQWQSFAKLVLDASYEATLCAAAINFSATGNNKVYLTLIGGGVFGNDVAWIIAAIKRALRIHASAGLDVVVVSYNCSNPALRELLSAR